MFSNHGYKKKTQQEQQPNSNFWLRPEEQKEKNLQSFYTTLAEGEIITLHYFHGKTGSSRQHKCLTTDQY